MKIKSIYIHMPFCLRKCNYCDFVSYPVHEHQSFRENYCQLLKQEIALYQKKEEIDLSELQTIYFGGGTPSLLQPTEVQQILDCLPPAREITLEANPETLDETKLSGYLQAGVNRLSIGVQSFNQQHLQAMGRGHSAEQAIEAVQLAQKVGYKNIGIDLIYGLPQQTIQQWQADLEQAVALNVQHMSLYCLSLEEDTPWRRLFQQGELPAIDDDLAADMFELTMQRLQAAGFCHYEISNFALPGCESRHNSNYWKRENYLGLGVAAAGCLLNYRLYNEKDLYSYQKKLQQEELPLLMDEALTIDQVISEAVFLGLRLLCGINFAAFAEQYGIDPRRRFKKQIANMAKKGLLSVDDTSMRLSERGIMLGNQVFAAFV